MDVSDKQKSDSSHCYRRMAWSIRLERIMPRLKPALQGLEKLKRVDVKTFLSRDGAAKRGRRGAFFRNTVSFVAPSFYERTIRNSMGTWDWVRKKRLCSPVVLYCFTLYATLSTTSAGSISHIRCASVSRKGFQVVATANMESYSEGRSDLWTHATYH